MGAGEMDVGAPPSDEIGNIRKMERLIEMGQELVKNNNPDLTKIRSVAIELMDAFVRAKEYYVQRHSAHSYECSEMITKSEVNFRAVMDEGKISDFSVFISKCLSFISRVKEDFTVKQKMSKE